MADPVITPAQPTSTAGAPVADPQPPQASPPANPTGTVVTGAAVDPAKAADPANPNPSDKTPAVKVVPEKYDIKLKEGSKLDAAHIEQVSKYAKENGLSNDEAQVLLDRESSAVGSYHERLSTIVNEKRAQWVENGKSDKEIGGDNYKQSVALANRVITKFGSEALVKELVDSGFGDHHEILRVFARIGKAIGEDKLVMPGSQPAGKKTMAEKFYGSSTPQQ